MHDSIYDIHENSEMKPKLADLILRGAVSEENYNKVRPEILSSNRKMLIALSAIAVLYLMVMFIASFFSADLVVYRWLYLVCCLLSAGVLFLVYRFGKENPAVLISMMYLFILMVLAFGGIMGTFMSVNELAVTYIALLLTLPMVFADRPIRMMCMIIISVAIFITCTCAVKDGRMQSIDITNAVVFGTISCICSVIMMRVKIERYVFAEQAYLLSRMDILTGLNNRNCFEQSLEEYTDKFHTSFGCIYADANGLHAINNNQGHEAGDIMLKTIALHLQSQFGKDHTYRIGGDEFVAFTLDKDEKQIEEMIAEAVSKIEAEGYFVSVGYAIQDITDNIDVQSLIKAAEVKMYVDKDAYYTRTGINHR